MEPSLPLAEIEWDHTPDPVAQERMLHESEVKEAAAAIIAARPSSSEMRVRFSLEPLKAPAGQGGARGTGLLLHHQEPQAYVRKPRARKVAPGEGGHAPTISTSSDRVRPESRGEPYSKSVLLRDPAPRDSGRAEAAPLATIHELQGLLAAMTAEKAAATAEVEELRLLVEEQDAQLKDAQMQTMHMTETAKREISELRGALEAAGHVEIMHSHGSLQEPQSVQNQSSQTLSSPRTPSQRETLDQSAQTIPLTPPPSERETHDADHICSNSTVPAATVEWTGPEASASADSPLTESANSQMGNTSCTARELTSDFEARASGMLSELDGAIAALRAELAAQSEDAERASALQSALTEKQSERMVLISFQLRLQGDSLEASSRSRSPSPHSVRAPQATGREKNDAAMAESLTVANGGTVVTALRERVAQQQELIIKLQAVTSGDALDRRVEEVLLERLDEHSELAFSRLEKARAIVQFRHQIMKGKTKILDRREERVQRSLEGMYGREYEVEKAERQLEANKEQEAVASEARLQELRAAELQFENYMVLGRQIQEQSDKLSEREAELERVLGDIKEQRELLLTERKELRKERLLFDRKLNVLKAKDKRSSKERANRRVPDVDLEASFQGSANEGFDGESVQTEQQSVSIHRSGRGSATRHMDDRSQSWQSPPPRFAMLTPTQGTGADLRHYQQKPLSFYDMPLPEVVNPKRAPAAKKVGAGSVTSIFELLPQKYVEDRQLREQLLEKASRAQKRATFKARLLPNSSVGKSPDACLGEGKPGRPTPPVHPVTFQGCPPDAATTPDRPVRENETETQPYASVYERYIEKIGGPGSLPVGVGGGGVGLGFARRVGSTGLGGDVEQISSWDTAGLPATPLMVDSTAST